MVTQPLNKKRGVFMKKSIFLDHIITAAEQCGASVDDMIHYAAALGFDGADVKWSIKESPCREYVLRYAEKLRTSNMSVSCVYRYCLLANGYSEADMRDFFRTVKEAGCTQAMIIPGKYKENRELEAVAIVKSLNELCDMAEEYGVMVTTEDFDSENAVISGIKDANYFLEKVPKLGFTLDTGNFICFGDDPLDAVKVFGNRITHVHLKDRSYTPLTEGDGKAEFTGLYSAPPGEGFLPIRECIKELQSIGYDGFVTAEHFLASDMKEYIRRSADFLNTVI